MQRDPIVTRCSELMRLGSMPSATEIKNGPVSTRSFHSHFRGTHSRYRMSSVSPLQPHKGPMQVDISTTVSGVQGAREKIGYLLYRNQLLNNLGKGNCDRDVRIQEVVSHRYGRLCRSNLRRTFLIQS